MFLTLNQALDMSPVKMAVVDGPYKQLIKITPEGGYRRVMKAHNGAIIPREGTAKELESLNCLFASDNINCRPVMEEVL